MNVIFLTLFYFYDVEKYGIYTDLIRKFRDEGHHVYVLTPVERRMHEKLSMEEQHGVSIIKVKTLNIQKTNIFEKGIGTLLLEKQYKNAIKKYIDDVNFDLILYSTPPITFTNVVKYLKYKNPQALTYLLLKDIFPQNAVDLGYFSKRSLFYQYFRIKEKKLYLNSNYIGCMSAANVKFIIDNNRYLNPNIVEIAPNSVQLPPQINESKIAIREEYSLPTNKILFIYGGNLGKPQGIDYLLECLKILKDRDDCFFIIAGAGTEAYKLFNWQNKEKPNNIKILKKIPRMEFQRLLFASDVGLIFLDNRFTIPNFPSRLLGYLENKLPIIVASDKTTDIGRIAEDNGFGFWCESINPYDFESLVDKYILNKSNIVKMGTLGYKYLKENYLVDNTYNVIIKHFV